MPEAAKLRGSMTTARTHAAEATEAAVPTFAKGNSLDPLPFRTRASKPASDRRSPLRGAGLLLVVALQLLGACASDYPLAPTICDDYCRAAQRADCQADAPADCVRDCEQERGRALCDGAWRALSVCYSESDPGAFFCSGAHSQVGRVCLSERHALAECLAPGRGACFDDCARRSEVCAVSLDECERGCRDAPPGCDLVSNRYYACLEGYPVECPGAPEQKRLPEEIPCYDEALEFLGCGN